MDIYLMSTQTRHFLRYIPKDLYRKDSIRTKKMSHVRKVNESNNMNTLNASGECHWKNDCWWKNRHNWKLSGSTEFDELYSCMIFFKPTLLKQRVVDIVIVEHEHTWHQHLQKTSSTIWPVELSLSALFSNDRSKPYCLLF